jgi:acetaldehyde dehydrogenase
MRIAIVGAGRTGADLLERLGDRPGLDVVLVADRDPAAVGLERAAERGIDTSTDGFDGVLAAAERPELVFDATTATSHRALGTGPAEAGIRVVDLTPAGVGALVIPAVNLDAVAGERAISLATPGAQAVVPLVAAVASVAEVRYAEVVSTLASTAVGPGARASVDDTLRTTVAALRSVGGARAAKAIVLVSPAAPPAPMRNALFCLVPPDADRAVITNALEAATASLALQVPGYRKAAGPLFQESDDDLLCVSLVVEVTTGVGGTLPSYAGNVELLTRAAVAVGERLALRQPVEAT